MGDFSIHMDRPDNPNTIIFNDFLDSLNLRNNTSFQTHISGHTLDLILDDIDESLVKCVKKGHFFTDHSVVQVTISMDKCNPLEKSVTYRNLRNINETDFRTDVSNWLTEYNTHDELEAKINCYNNVILSTLEKHAPKKTKVVKFTHKQPWFSDKIKAKIRLRNRKESTWNKDPNEYTYQAFYNQRRHCSNIIKSAQRQYFMEKILENQYNYKEIFRLTNKYLGKDNELPLQPTEELSVLANNFNNFFMSKIRKIMQDLAPNNITNTSDDYLESAFKTTEKLTNFKLVTD